MKRTQIYIDEHQDRELARRAKATGVTKSELIRRAIENLFAATDDEALRLARFRRAVTEAAGVAPLLAPGEVYVDGVALSTLNEAQLSDLRLNKIGFVFQAYNLIPVLSARENVEFIMQLQGVSANERNERAVRMLDSLGIGELANRRPGELSGGQQQRVAVARAIVTNPVLLLADEPSANLDSTTTEELLGLLTRINREHGVTILTATHDPVVMSYAGRHVQLRDGRIVSDEKAGSVAA
jgi:putative ABC transport system ATP-binding protein